MWSVWLERNRHSFEDNEKTLDELKGLCQRNLLEWSHCWGFTDCSSLSEFMSSLSLVSWLLILLCFLFFFPVVHHHEQLVLFLISLIIVFCLPIKKKKKMKGLQKVICKWEQLMHQWGRGIWFMLREQKEVQKKKT